MKRLILIFGIVLLALNVSAQGRYMMSNSGNLGGGGGYGIELVTNGAFTTDLTSWSGTNWAWNSPGNNLHTTGTTNAAYQNISTVHGSGIIVHGDPYLVSFTIGGRTTGSVLISIGNDSAGGLKNTNEVHEEEINGGTLDDYVRIVPSSDFDGWIDDISIKKVL